MAKEMKRAQTRKKFRGRSEKMKHINGIFQKHMQHSGKRNVMQKIETRKKLRKGSETMKHFDGTFQTPLTAIVAGPSGGGKTTFVSNLLKRADDFFDTKFKYIQIYIGTRLEDSKIWKELKEIQPSIKIVEIWSVYKDDADLEKNFKKNFWREIEEMGGNGGCIVFDDMMRELSRCGLISELFSKDSSHKHLTIFHITQNMFYKGKDPNEHVTLYRNAHLIVLFLNPNDSSIVATVAKRLETGNRYKQLMQMFSHVLNTMRYVVIYGGFKRNPVLRYTSDIFNTDPVPFQRVFSLE